MVQRFFSGLVRERSHRIRLVGLMIAACTVATTTVISVPTEVSEPIPYDLANFTTPTWWAKALYVTVAGYTPLAGDNVVFGRGPGGTPITTRHKRCVRANRHGVDRHHRTAIAQLDHRRRLRQPDHHVPHTRNRRRTPRTTPPRRHPQSRQRPNTKHSNQPQCTTTRSLQRPDSSIRIPWRGSSGSNRVRELGELSLIRCLLHSLRPRTRWRRNAAPMA